jgi:formylglycine-generating enzyme
MSCLAVEQPEHLVALSAFALDKFEVTVGRFRAFVEAGAGTQANPPAAESGAHPLIPGSGWDSVWNLQLAPQSAELLDGLKCDAALQTWRDAPGTAAQESHPINCVTWFDAFAFCIWDGGRLPTEAEWEYAAGGGDENRIYPWGDDVAEPLPANYDGTDGSPFVVVGSHPSGDGRWGHSDLAGSMWELVFDYYKDDFYTDTRFGCSDCANLTPSSERIGRGGSWFTSAAYSRSAFRAYSAADSRLFNLGFRCARSVP